MSLSCFFYSPSPLLRSPHPSSSPQPAGSSRAGVGLQVGKQCEASQAWKGQSLPLPPLPRRTACSPAGIGSVQCCPFSPRLPSLSSPLFAVVFPPSMMPSSYSAFAASRQRHCRSRLSPPLSSSSREKTRSFRPFQPLPVSGISGSLPPAVRDSFSARLSRISDFHLPFAFELRQHWLSRGGSSPPPSHQLHPLLFSIFPLFLLSSCSTSPSTLYLPPSSFFLLLPSFCLHSAHPHTLSPPHSFSTKKTKVKII
mmetsp:Transcript_30893/g.81094  ORF Transcript_30893/g.81094 Transcript_30893/m.81094 type:complete len:254 (-) Transcript_30893:82-843(-)